MAEKVHIDGVVAQDIIKLDDDLMAFERQTGRQYTFILIPHSSDEPIHISMNGKVVPKFDPRVGVENLLDVALSRRESDARQQTG